MNDVVKKVKRNIDGLLLLDKSKGVSSNHALQKVKRLYCALKAGHGGSLDPLATGMLPICLGEATKFSQFLLDHRKRYLVTGCLGITTTTGDAEGDIVQRVENPQVDITTLNSVLTQFKGEISQVPPIYSALKHNGQPLYRLARKGIEVEIKPRLVTIYTITLISLENEFFTCEVECSKGTYIRTLIEDIGHALGFGAYVTELRRLQVGEFMPETMITFAQLELLDPHSARDALLIPMDALLKDFPAVVLSQPEVTALFQGKKIKLPEQVPQDLVRLYAEDDQFLGLGSIDDTNTLISKRLISTVAMVG